MSNLNILVAGATGYVGRDVVAELVRRGHRVTALVRAASPAASDPWVQEALHGAQPRSWHEVLSATAPPAFDVVVSCIASRTGVAHDAWQVDYQRNMDLLERAHQGGAKRFVLLSAICVQKPRLAFQFAKLKFEQALAASGLDYAIVRPTAYFKSLAGQIGRIRAGKPYLMFGDGSLTACRPISTADLARYLADHAESVTAANDILPVGGPGAAITPREQGQMLFELAGMPAKFRSVPPAMFSVAAGVLGTLGRVIRPLRTKAELARIGHYYATESMLVWDAPNDRYAPELTPAFGDDTLRAFYQRALKTGLGGHELGDQRVFSRADD